MLSTSLPDCSKTPNAPAVQRASPSTLPWFGGSIIIYGQNLQHVVKVQVGSKLCKSLQHSSSRSISCIVQPTEEPKARIGFIASSCELTSQQWIHFHGWTEKEGWIWRAAASGGDLPSPRAGHSLTVDQSGRLLLFGGITEIGSMSDLYVHDGKWSKIGTKSSPAPRSEHVAWMYENFLYIFGGWYNADFENADSSPVSTGNRTAAVESVVYNDMHRYDLADGRWRTFSQLSGTPSRRRGACTVRDSDAVYLFGGHDSVGSSMVGPQDDGLYSLNLVNLQWTRMTKNGRTSPPPLAYAAMVMWDDGTGQPSLYLFGGMQPRMQLTSDLWSYNLQSRTWKQMFPKAAVLPFSSFVGRQMHLMVPMHDRLFVFGGQSVKASKAFCVIFEVLTGKWKDESCLFDASSICRLPVQNVSDTSASSSAASSSSCYQLQLEGQRLLTGVNVSGTYRATGEQLEGRLVYKKVDLNFEVGDTATLIFYWASYWVVGPAVIPYRLKDLQLVMEPSQAGSSFLYASSGASSPVEAAGWNEIDPLSKMWQASPSFSVRCSSSLACNGVIFQQECWHLVKQKKIYGAARKHCARLGGRLAGIHTKFENDFVFTFLQQTMSSDPYVWIGLHHNSTWSWEDGLSSFFYNWAYGEPDGRGWAQPAAASVYQEQAWFIHRATDSNELELLPASPWCGPALTVVQAAAAMANGSLMVFGGLDDSKFSSTLHEFVALSAGEMFSWEPTVDDVRPHLAISPHQSLTIFGRGLCHPNLSASIGAEACTKIRSLSSSQLLCEVPMGVGANLPIGLHHEPFQLAPLQQQFLFNYTPPAITFIEPTEGSTAGGEVLTIHGKYFGGAGVDRAVYVGGKSCQKVTWEEDKAAECQVPANSDGGKATVKVIVGGQVSTWDAYVYAVEVPRLISIHPSTGPAAGGHVITVEGENLNLLQSIALNDTACSITMQQPTSVTCMVGPMIGRGWRVNGIDSRGVRVVSGALVYDVDPPMVTGFLALRPTAGGSYPTLGADIVIVGRNFGTTRSRVRVFIGSSAALTSFWVDDTMINCRVAAGVGSQLELRVDVAEQRARILQGLRFSYNPPVVEQVKPDRLLWDELQLVTMLGSSFGRSRENVSIFIRSPRGVLRIPPAFNNDSLLTFQLRPWLDGVVRPPARYQMNAQLSFAVKVANQVGMKKVWLVAASSSLNVTVQGNSDSVNALVSSLSSLASVQGDAIPARDVHVQSIRRSAFGNWSLGHQNFSSAAAVVYSVRFLSSVGDQESGVRRFRRAISELRSCCREEFCDVNSRACGLRCLRWTCKPLSPLPPFLCIIPYSPGPAAEAQETPSKNRSSAGKFLAQHVPMVLHEDFTTRWIIPTASVSSLLLIVLVIAIVIVRYEQQYQKEAQNEEVNVESDSSSTSDPNEFDVFDLEEEASQSSRNIEMAVLADDVSGKEDVEMKELSPLSKGSKIDALRADEEEGDAEEPQEYLMLTIAKPKPKPTHHAMPQESLQQTRNQATAQAHARQVEDMDRASVRGGEKSTVAAIDEDKDKKDRTLTSRLNAGLGNIADKIRGLDVRRRQQARYDSLGTEDEPDDPDEESASEDSEAEDSARSLLNGDEQSDQGDEEDQEG